MQRRILGVLSLLIVLGLVVADLAMAMPPAIASSTAEAVAPQAGTAAATPALAGKAKRDRRKKDKRHKQGKQRQRNAKRDRNDVFVPKNAVPKQDQPRELAGGRLPAATTAGAAAEGSLSAEDRYIVLLKGGGRGQSTSSLSVASDIAADEPGVVPTHVYEHVFNGFAAIIPDGQVEAVRQDPRVEAVVPDGISSVAQQPLLPGVDRVDAEKNLTSRINGVDERVDVDVAVLDTAGQGDHPDLWDFAWYNCTTSTNNGDAHSHGTHVAGTVGALDNSFGVVGVAPGARLWKIKVLGDNGSGLNSWIICGLDMVTAYANDQGDGFGDIEVANVSIGGGGFDTDCRIALSDAYHQAYCRAVAAGVTVVVAAGNDAVNASGAVPAAYDEVITVSALADSDGQPGGVGPLTSGGPDDSLADFSNFGFDVDIAAPGVDIQSTMPGGGYGFKNGTSMASPHVAGAAALYLARSPGASPAQVRSYLLAKREQIALPNDFDGFNEGVLNVADAPVVAPPPTVSPAPAGTHKNRKNRKKRAKGGKRGKR